MTKYPEHEKLRIIADESQAIGEFIEMSGYTLCELRTFTEPLDDAGNTYKTRPQFVPVAKDIQQILADYFEIDLEKIEDEKRSMLETLQRNARIRNINDGNKNALDHITEANKA